MDILKPLSSYLFIFADRRDYIVPGLFISFLSLIGWMFGFESLFLGILILGFILVVPPSALIFLIAISIYYGNSIAQEELWIAAGGINIMVSDFLYAILVLKIIAFVIKNPTEFQRYLRENKEISIWLGYFFMLILLGLSAYSKRAIGDARYFFPTILAFAIPMFFTIKQINRMFLILIPIIILLSVAGIIWGEPPQDAGIARSEFRYLNSTMALTCGIILLLGIICSRNKEMFHQWWWLVLIYLFGVVVITQHRSVWVGFTIGIIVFLFRNKISIKIVLQGAFLVVCALTLVLVLSPVIRDSLVNSLLFVSQGAEADQTGSWRLLYWAEAWSKIQTSPIFGRGFGEYYEALAETGVAVSLHNFYIHILFKTGVVGLILQILIFVKVISRLSYLSRGDDAEKKFLANMLFAVVWMNLTYFLFYSMELLTGLLVGYVLLLDIESKQRAGQI